MKIRLSELARAIARLPDPNSQGPEILTLPFDKVPFVTQASGDVGPLASMPLSRVTFRKETFGVGTDRWTEWTLDLAD